MSVEHVTLQILKGVFAAPGDANSAEAPIEGLDLLAPDGLALDVEGWSPNLPALKSRTAWAESAISDGRQPLSSSVGNVNETLRLTMVNRDLEQRMMTFKQLGRLKEAIENFWTTYWQIDPVYLRWHATRGAGDQYALIYNLEIAQRSDVFDLETAWDVTLTIEREPYWRGLWPGANPLEWTFEFRGIARGSQEFDTDDLDLGTGTDHLIYDDSISNKHEWYPTPPYAYFNTISNNFIDIPADLIPGDVPALLELDIDPGESTFITKSLFVSRWTKPTAVLGHIYPNRRAPAMIWAAADASGNSGVTKTVDATNGVISNGSSTIRYYVNTTFATNPTDLFFGTKPGFIPGNVDWDLNMLRGTFAVFVRNAQQAGAQGDIDFTLTFYMLSSSSQTQVLTGQATLATGSGAWAVSYMGTIQLPFNNPVLPSTRGFGIDHFTEATTTDPLSTLVAKLRVQRTTGASTLQLLDLILMPIDEWVVEISNPDTGTGDNTQHYTIDSTGYLSHGRPDLIATITDHVDATRRLSTPVEIRGSGFVLQPGVNNRLYFWNWRNPTGQDTRSDPHLTMTVRGNIIPRWSGIRDV